MDHIQFDQESTRTHCSEIFGKFLDSIKILFFFSSLENGVVVYALSWPIVVQRNAYTRVYAPSYVSHFVYSFFILLLDVLQQV